MKKFLFTSLFIIGFLFLSTGLKAKAKVHLISFSSSFNHLKIDAIKKAFNQKGYQVKVDYLNQVISDFGYVNTDEERADNLIAALTDNEVKFLWVLRGGGGALNLLPELKENLIKIKRSATKTLIGFSDVTALHLFINQYLPNWRTVHGVTASYSNDTSNPLKEIQVNDLEPLPDIANLLESGIYYKNVFSMNELARNDTEGILIGGNLTLIQATFGTDFEPDFNGKIVLMEDVGVTFRQLDRTLNQLLMHHRIKDATGFLFGQFYPLDPTDSERLIYKAVIENFAKKINKPVYYYPLIGHGRKNKPLILGEKISFQCQPRKNCTMKQVGITVRKIK